MIYIEDSYDESFVQNLERFCKKYFNVTGKEFNITCPKEAYFTNVGFTTSKKITAYGLNDKDYLESFSMQCKDYLGEDVNLNDWYVVMNIDINADSLVFVTGIKRVDYEFALSERGLKLYTVEKLMELF